MPTRKSALLVVAVVCLAFGTIPGYGELNFPMITLDSTYVAYERDIGDVNNDGANDVVCLSENEKVIRAFLAPNWTNVVLTTPTGAYTWPRADDFKASDLDGDGDADLVVRLGPAQNSDAAGIAAWFENRGSTGWVQHTIGTSSGYVKDIGVADLDLDGRRDVIMRQDAETQIYFQEASSWLTVTLSHQPHEGMEVADVDGDSRPDIVLNGFWFPTPRTPTAARLAANYTNLTIDASWYDQTGDWTANSCKVVVGDFNGDSRADIAFSHSERAGYSVTWYRSPTPLVPGSWTASTIQIVDYCHSLQAADWDLDGDTDLLTGGMSGSPHAGLKLLLNENNGTHWSEFAIQSDGSYSAEMGDIDNDGDQDIVGIRNWNSAPSYIYRNNAGGGPSLDFWRYIPISASHARTFGLCFPDIDRDGNLDIASGRFVYRNPGPPMTNTWIQISLPASVLAFTSLDVDGDNLADLMALQDNPGDGRLDIFWVEAANVAGSSWAAPVRIGDVPRSEHTEGFQGSRVAELVTGSPPEIILSTMQGIYYFSIPTSHPDAGNWPRTFLAPNDSNEGIAVADIDGDNDLDIAFTTGSDKSIRWTRNPGDGSGNWPIYTIGLFPEADWPDRCEAADLNGDGRMDIIATEENSGASADALACWWEQPTGGATNAAWIRHTIATQYTMNNLDATDMDRDGDIDLILAEHRGTKRIAVWQNDGAGGFAEKRVAEGRESHLGGQLADLDTDGDLDIVSIAYDGYQQVHLWRNDSPAGTPTVARPSISPNGGVFDEILAVTLSCSTAGAEIWYSFDGTTPTNQAPALLFTNAPIAVTTSLTIRALGFKTDHLPSPVATATFLGPQVSPPLFSPPGGIFTATQTVAISCATTGVTIHFTINGANPQESDPLYSGPITLTETTTLKARAWRLGILPSDVATTEFTRFKVGAVAHWRLDEHFGSWAADSSGHSHTGTVSGAEWTSGIRQNALAFDGADDRVECGSWSVTGTALTFCAWIKLAPNFNPDSDARILSKATGSAEQDHWWMLSTTRVGDDIRLRARLKAGGSTVTAIATSSSLSLDTWIHVAASYDNASLRLFVNGVLAGNTSKSGILDESVTVPVWIGANPPSAYAPFHGSIDDVRIYNTVMDGEAIAAVMNDNPPRRAPRLLTLERGVGDSVCLTGEGDIGHILQLTWTTNLLFSDWEIVSTQALTDSAIHHFCVTSTLYQLFFRLQME